MPSIDITDLSQQRPLQVDLTLSRLGAEPGAFDSCFTRIAQETKHPLLRLEAWGNLVEAQRRNKTAPYVHSA